MYALLYIEMYSQKPPLNLNYIHILEDHMVNFLLNWRVGCGLLGEQGAESIHKVYNQLKAYNIMLISYQRRRLL